MERFKNILYCCQRPETPDRSALERAVTLATNNQARLSLVTVVEESAHFLRSLVPELGDAQELVEQERRKRLEELARELSGPQLQVAAKVLAGSPHIQIIREVIREGHDLVMATARSVDVDEPHFFGSTVTRLLRKCPCPVWALKRRLPGQFNRVLAAVDPTRGAKERENLNRKILELAASLAGPESTDLHVVFAWDVYGESLLKNRLSPAELASLRGDAEQRAKKALGELLERVGVEVDAEREHVVKGDAGEAIPRLVDELGVDLVVMGTVARTGIPGLVIGNTAEKVLARLRASVLAVKPDGFVSPVELE